MLIIDDKEALAKLAHHPDYYMENFNTLKMNKEGTPKNHLSASYMAHYPDENTTELDYPELKIFRENKLPINVILSSIFILIFLTYYKSVYKNIDKDLFTESKGDNIYYNNKIKKLLSEIKDYKYLSPHNYKRGIQLWKSFSIFYVFC